MYTKLLSVALILISLSGCAVGQKFSYMNTKLSAEKMDSVRSVSVAVLDQRQYVLSGNKSESFVGLSRGGFGNPFDVTTQSGDPMASDMSTSISDALKADGIRVQSIAVRPDQGQEKAQQALVRTGSERLLLFILNEWKTDTMARTGLIFDVTLDVFDSSGQKLATSQTSGKEVSGSSILSADKDAQNWFSAKATQLLNDQAIVNALE